MNIFKKLKARVKLIRAVRLADETFAKTGERQYVIPNGSKLVSISREQLKYLKKKGYVGRSANVKSLEKGAFYFTPYKDGSKEMPDELRKARRFHYLRWFSQTN